MLEQVPEHLNFRGRKKQNLLNEIRKIDKEDLIVKFPQMVNVAKER